ncbi:glycoside hydrolase family 43 protein [Actinomycetes bacterium KLBMP 9797]
MKKVLAMLVAAVVVLVAGPVTAAAGDSVTLELDRNFADPSFIQAGDTFYAFSTGNGFPVASAPSMRGPWTVLGRSMPTRPAWTVAGWDWAPDVFQRESDGRFIMYFTARDRATDRQCIGVATATSPAGPYVDALGHAPICPPNGRDVIDPSPFTKLDGTHWVIYNMKGGNIRATRMLADQIHNAGEPPITLIADNPVTEAPVILRSGPRLVMFTSRNFYADGCRYKTEAFVSVGLTAGTWTSLGDVLSRGNTGLCGPGGADLVRSGGETWIMFHAWRCDVAGCDVATTEARHRSMLVGTIGWGADGLTPRIE